MHALRAYLPPQTFTLSYNPVTYVCSAPIKSAETIYCHTRAPTSLLQLSCGASEPVIGTKFLQRSTRAFSEYPREIIEQKYPFSLVSLLVRKVTLRHVYFYSRYSIHCGIITPDLRIYSSDISNRIPSSPLSFPF